MNDLQPWIAICKDGDGGSIYYFTAQNYGREKMRRHFEKLVAEQGWAPFDDVQIYQFVEAPQKDVLRKLATF